MTLIAKGLYSAVTQNLCYVDTLRDVALIRAQNSLCFLSISAIEIHLLVDTDTNFPTKMQKRDNPSNRFHSVVRIDHILIFIVGDTMKKQLLFHLGLMQIPYYVI